MVDRLSLEVVQEESFGLVGESGSGKSMTALAIMRLLPVAARVTDGQIRFEGRDLLALTDAEMREIRGRRIGLVFQQAKSALNPLMRVGDQVARIIRARGKVPSDQVHDSIFHLLRRVGLSDSERVAYSFPHQLSGGMAQRVLIAMALAAEPQLLIADEPTTGLDVTTEAQIFDLIHELRRDLRITLLLITHDLALVAENCDRLAVVHAGRVVESGTVKAVFQQPLHPYTQSLVSAFSRTDRGSIPELELGDRGSDVLQLPDVGCRFLSRCPYRMENCVYGVSPVEPEPGHTVLCRLYE